MKNIALLIFCVAAVSACGTVEGIGNDLSAASRGVQGWF
ncbi:MAG: entericidin EcnA/B family protein [Pseudomonadota bacterium]